MELDFNDVFIICFIWWEKLLWMISSKNFPTILSELEKVTKTIFKKNMKIRSSGRTDRYVHSLSLPVLIFGDESIDKDTLMILMNKELPKDIRVNKIEMVNNNFEVRFNTKYKIYKYLTNLKGEGDSDYFNNHTYPFNLSKLIKCSELFIGKKDFASFTAKSGYINTFRTIMNIDISVENDVLTILIKGDGFMRFMVRNIVGILLAHNRGAITDEEVNDLFINPQIGKSHYKARGSGLYLVDVFY